MPDEIIMQDQLIAPRIAHNRALLAEYLKGHPESLAQWPLIENQKPTTYIKGLRKAAYNACIFKHKGMMLCVYRFHGDETNPLMSQLAIAELNDSFEATHDEVLDLDADVSAEDGRLFECAGELYLVYVSSTWPSFPSSVMKSVRLSKPDHWRCDNPIELSYKDRQTMEKNWVPLCHSGEAWYIYQSHLKQIVFRGSSEHVTDALTWPFGEIRGGTTPLPWKKKWLRFFHSSTRNEMPPITWRYFIGAIIMDDKPPFKMLQISRYPILVGCEYGGDRSVRHRKSNIVFPMGCVVEGDKILLSVGVNDSAAAVVSLTEKDLQL